jgi:uncharacterized protein (TIGR03435 family)
MEELARSPFLQGDRRAIVNRTGLEGRFNFRMTFSADGGTDAPALSTALQEQPGVRLVSEKGRAEVIVIDHIERPSGN